MSWFTFISPWFGLWLVGARAPLTISRVAWRKTFQWLIPFTGVTLLGGQAAHAHPLQRLVASSLLFLYVMKGCILLSRPIAEARRISFPGLLLFMTLWPGMRAESFVKDPGRVDRGEVGKLFGRGLALCYIAIAILLGLALGFPYLPASVVGWAAIGAVLLLIHWGFSSILTALFRLAGWPVEKLFDAPERSRSLREFWTKRWNLAFVEMDRRLFMPFLARRLGPKGAVFGVFLISGLLHEMALSYPAAAGYGGPLLYFALQGGLVLVEQKLRLRSRLFAWCSVLAPLPLLFHSAFRSAFMVPLVAGLHEQLVSRSLTWYLGGLLWVLGFAQLLVLAASFQVPSRLGWKEELPRLSTFNRKLMWSYGGFIVLNILAFAAFTFIFHNDLVNGVPAALGFAGFAALFWILRLAVDFFYYSPEDWPVGPELEVGHALLNSLFLLLALGYSSVVVINVWHRV